MFDFNKLRGRIKEKFGSESEFARKMGLSRSTMSQKLNNVWDFSSSEIIKACDLLDIEYNDIPIYFFTTKV